MPPRGGCAHGECFEENQAARVARVGSIDGYGRRVFCECARSYGIAKVARAHFRMRFIAAGSFDMPSNTSDREKNCAPVLDQGIVITGDLVVKLMGLKLLPVKVRLLVSSTKLASDLGLDWWRDERSGKKSSSSSSGEGKKKRSKKKSMSGIVTRRDRSERNGARHQS
jgi:hypothetical protein